MKTRWNVVGHSVATALIAYVVAGLFEAGVIRTVRPSEWTLAWVSDVVLSVALGVAVYLWRDLRATRQELAERERAELVLDTQLSVAAEIQRRLLPDLPPAAHGMTWAACLKSAGKIGGDFYDVVQVAPGRWLVLAADVSGKGVPAAMALGALRAAFRAEALESARPAPVLDALSATLYRDWGTKPYVTALVALVDAGARTLTYAGAGHPAGLLVRESSVVALESLGPPAGLFPGLTYEQRTLDLRPGDVCVLVSDGVTEALESGPTPARDIIVAAVRSHRASAQTACDAVMARALEGRGPADVPDWQDDRTTIVFAIGADDGR